MFSKKEKRKRLYNYIVNTLNVSKEMIMEQVDIRVQEVLDKHIHNLLNSNRIENIIMNKVTEFLTKGIPDQHHLFYSRTKFDDYVKSLLREVIKERVNEEFNLEVKIVKKEDGVIRRV